MEQHTYKYLKGLVDSDFQIVDGEPNIIGWKVKNETGAFVGNVEDLLFDPQTNSVRYIIIDLTNNGMSLDDKRVMIPIGIAHLHTHDDEVVLPNVHQQQFNALPSYKLEDVGPESEVSVREIIGSPAALRIEEKVVEFDQENFYNHQSFDRDHFYKRGGNPNRIQQQDTIHNLVENSKANDLHAADHEKGSGTQHEHTTKPWLVPGANHNQGGDDNPTPDHDGSDNNCKL